MGKVSSFWFLKHFDMHGCINFCVTPKGKSRDNQLMFKRHSENAIYIEIEQGYTNRLELKVAMLYHNFIPLSHYFFHYIFVLSGSARA